MTDERRNSGCGRIRTCRYCGSTDEVRPYGPGGSNICFSCASGGSVTSGIEGLYEHLREEPR